MNKVFERIRQLAVTGYHTKKKSYLRDLDSGQMANHLHSEVCELYDALRFKDPKAIYELADILCIALHFAVKNGWGLEQIETAMLEKLALRFTEPDAAETKPCPKCGGPIHILFNVSNRGAGSGYYAECPDGRCGYVCRFGSGDYQTALLMHSNECATIKGSKTSKEANLLPCPECGGRVSVVVDCERPGYFGECQNCSYACPRSADSYHMAVIRHNAEVVHRIASDWAPKVDQPRAYAYGVVHGKGYTAEAPQANDPQAPAAEPAGFDHRQIGRCPLCGYWCKKITEETMDHLGTIVRRYSVQCESGPCNYKAGTALKVEDALALHDLTRRNTGPQP